MRHVVDSILKEFGIMAFSLVSVVCFCLHYTYTAYNFLSSINKYNIMILKIKIASLRDRLFTPLSRYFPQAIK